MNALEIIGAIALGLFLFDALVVLLLCRRAKTSKLAPEPRPTGMSSSVPVGRPLSLVEKRLDIAQGDWDFE